MPDFIVPIHSLRRLSRTLLGAAIALGVCVGAVAGDTHDHADHGGVDGVCVLAAGSVGIRSGTVDLSPTMAPPVALSSVPVLPTPRATPVLRTAPARAPPATPSSSD